MPRRKTAPSLAPDAPALSAELARLIGVKSPIISDAEPNAAEPETMLDWALHWAGRGLAVFPARRFLGSPLVKSWYSEATTKTSNIVDWWAEWPEADIGCVPDQSGHYVIAAHADEGGLQSLAAIEAAHGPLPADFRTADAWENEFVWMRGSAFTSHHRLGHGLHVLGTGNYVFLPASWAPHLVYRT